MNMVPPFIIIWLVVHLLLLVIIPYNQPLLYNHQPNINNDWWHGFDDCYASRCRLRAVRRRRRNRIRCTLAALPGELWVGSDLVVVTTREQGLVVVILLVVGCGGYYWWVMVATTGEYD